MTGPLTFLLSFFILLATANCNLLIANDYENCINLCTSCNGQATFVNSICNCSIPENDTKSLECVRLLQEKTEDLELESESDNEETSDRSARRCWLHSRKRLGSIDGRRVADYFIKGGPLSRSPIESFTGKCESTSDRMIGAINPNNAVSPPEETDDDKHADSYKSSQYQPIVGTSWVASPVAAYSPMIAAPQPALYSPMMGAYPQMLYGIPHESARSPHIPIHHRGLVGSAHHTPIVPSHCHCDARQRHDKIIAPCTAERKNKIIGAIQHKSNCPLSSQSSTSTLGESAPICQTQSSWISDSTLQQYFARQNSLLESLNNKLKCCGQQFEAPKMHYAQVPAPIQYMVGPPQTIGQFVAQPTSGYCSVGSNILGNPNPTETQFRYDQSSSSDSELPEKLPNPSSSRTITHDDDENSNCFAKRNANNDTITKEIEGNDKNTEDESQKFKRETKNSSDRKKRGDAKKSVTTVSKDK